MVATQAGNPDLPPATLLRHAHGIIEREGRVNTRKKSLQFPVLLLPGATGKGFYSSHIFVKK